MTPFQLYKVRNFNALINDTFGFFKQEGKNYFRNYFLINGLLLLALVVLIFIVGRVYFENIFAGISNPSGDSGIAVFEYFNNNIGFFISIGIFAMLVLLFLSMVSYSFPVIYLQFTEKNIIPDNKQLWRAIVKKLGKTFVFCILSLFTFVPIAILLGLISMLLVVVIIGIPVGIAVFAALSCWVSLSLYDYLSTGNGYFTAMGNGFKMLFQNFWPHMGSTAVIFGIMYAVQTIISIIIYAIGMFMFLFDTDSSRAGQTAENMSMLGLVFMIVFLLSILFSYFMTNILMVSQGLIYYSCKESDEHHTVHTEIDLIGSDFETE